MLTHQAEALHRPARAVVPGAAGFDCLTLGVDDVPNMPNMARAAAC
jgi:hypothetical protein